MAGEFHDLLYTSSDLLALSQSRLPNVHVGPRTIRSRTIQDRSNFCKDSEKSGIYNGCALLIAILHVPVPVFKKPTVTS